MIHVDWKRLMNAAIVVGILIAIMGVIILLCHYLPWVTLSICVILLIIFFYWLMGAAEEDDKEDNIEQ